MAALLFLINFCLYLLFNYTISLVLSWQVVFFGGMACCIVMTIAEYQIIRLHKTRHAKKRQEMHRFQIQPVDMQSDNSIRYRLLQSIVSSQDIDSQINAEQQLLQREKSKKIQSKKRKAQIANIEKRIEKLREQQEQQLWDAEAGLTDLEKEKYTFLCQSFKELKTSQKKFYLDNADKPQELSLDFTVFKFIHTTNPVPAFQYNNSILYIYPKFFLKIENQVLLKVSEFETDGKITYYESQVEEEHFTTNDSPLLSAYYLHTNKDGSPDLRYSYNPRIRIKGYGLAHIALQNDINKFLFSNSTAAKKFVQAWQALTSPTSTVAEPIEEDTGVSVKKIKVDPLFLDAAHWTVQSQQGSTSMMQRKFEIGFNRAARIMEQLEAAGIVGAAIGSKPRQMLVHTEYELAEILSSLHILPIFTKETEDIRKSVSNNTDNITDSKYQDELKSLIGLDKVKKEVAQLANFIKMQQLRSKRGLKTTSVSYHCVFTGNPGTGKTTVARIVAQIYKELGILGKGHLVETDRSGLVAEYVGQTAVKTNKIIDSALDGVLFIDEAYSLATNNGSDYGKEAIATLLKRMEDDRNRLVVILAGYHNEMKIFIDSNPGLQSRFNRYIDFPDYTSDELMQIFCRNVEKADYHLTDEAKQKLQEQLNEAVKAKDKNFGNARFVRNIFEKTLEQQANRLAGIENPTTEQLRNIIVQDIVL